MKRFFKRKNKRGFTLLEVMLATCIMTICSTMIMKGFMSTMNYAHNNNVYNKMGAKNYNSAMSKVTKMVGYGDGDGLQKRIDELKTNGGAGGVKEELELSIRAGGAGSDVNGKKLVVKHWEFNDNTGINLSDKVKGTYAEGASAVSHRHSFFFQPTIVKCPIDDKHKVRYCVVQADATKNGWYCRESSCTYKDKIG